MIEEEQGDKHLSVVDGVDEQETKGVKEKEYPLGYREAMRWVKSRGFQSKPTTNFYQKALVVCERYNLPEEMRNGVLFDWYKKLVNEGQIEEAERIREENAIVAERFPLTTKEYLAQRATRKQEKIDMVRQATTDKKESEATELAKPTNQLRQAIKDDDLETGLSLLKEHPDLTDFLLPELISLIEETKKPNQAYRWSEASNNPATQRAIFEKLFAYRLKSTRPDLIAEFYHGRDYEVDLVKSAVEEFITSGEDLRQAVKLAQIIGGDYETEIGQRCLEIARLWEKSSNRYERAKHDNLKDLIAHNPYH